MDKFSKQAKLFYDEARRFSLCGDAIRFSNIREEDDQYLFSPIIYIERHTVELLLKSLILCSISKCESYLKYAINNIPVLDLNGNSINRTLFNTHSLLALLEFYRYLEEGKLFPNYSKVEIKKVETTIKRFEKIDKGATFFRYPINKDKAGIKNNARKYIQKIDDEHPLSLVEEGAYVLENGGEIQYSIKSLRIVKMEYDLTKTIIILFNLSPFQLIKKDLSKIV